VVRASTKLLELMGGSIVAHSHGQEFKARPRNHYHYQRLRDIPQLIQENTGFVPQNWASGTYWHFAGIHCPLAIPSHGVMQCESMLGSLSGTK
jgi:hypothetical protein